MAASKTITLGSVYFLNLSILGTGLRVWRYVKIYVSCDITLDIKFRLLKQGTNLTIGKNWTNNQNILVHVMIAIDFLVFFPDRGLFGWFESPQELLILLMKGFYKLRCIIYFGALGSKRISVLHLIRTEISLSRAFN